MRKQKQSKPFAFWAESRIVRCFRFGVDDAVDVLHVLKYKRDHSDPRHVLLQRYRAIFQNGSPRHVPVRLQAALRDFQCLIAWACEKYKIDVIVLVPGKSRRVRLGEHLENVFDQLHKVREPITVIVRDGMMYQSLNQTKRVAPASRSGFVRVYLKRNRAVSLPPKANVLILDDIVASGATIDHMVRLIRHQTRGTIVTAALARRVF